MKKLLGVLLAACMVVGVGVCGTVGAGAASYTYNADAALKYAKNNVNTSREGCAGFVSKCLKDGGLNMTYSAGTGPCIRSICTAIGIPYRTDGNIDTNMKALVATLPTLTLNASGYPTTANNGILQAGDVVFQWCSTCPISPHLLICSGYKDGLAVFYATSSPCDNKTYNFKSNSGHAGHTLVGKVLQIRPQPTTTTKATTTTNPGLVIAIGPVKITIPKDKIIGPTNNYISKDIIASYVWGTQLNGVRIYMAEHGSYKNNLTGYDANFIVYKDKKLEAVFTGCSTLPDAPKTKCGDSPTGYPAILKDGEYPFSYGSAHYIPKKNDHGYYWKVKNNENLPGIYWDGLKSKFVEKTCNGILIHKGLAKTTSGPWSTGCLTINGGTSDFFKYIGTASGTIKIVRDRDIVPTADK